MRGHAKFTWYSINEKLDIGQNPNYMIILMDVVIIVNHEYLSSDLRYQVTTMNVANFLWDSLTLSVTGSYKDYFQRWCEVHRLWL